MMYFNLSEKTDWIGEKNQVSKEESDFLIITTTKYLYWFKFEFLGQCENYGLWKKRPKMNEGITF